MRPGARPKGHRRVGARACALCEPGLALAKRQHPAYGALRAADDHVDPAGAQTGASALDRPETGDVHEGKLGEVEHDPHAAAIDAAHSGRERLGPGEVELPPKGDDVVVCDCPMGRLKPNRRVEVLPQSSHTAAPSKGRRRGLGQL
jgi:hypothetical protein